MIPSTFRVFIQHKEIINSNTIQTFKILNNSLGSLKPKLNTTLFLAAYSGANQRCPEPSRASDSFLTSALYKFHVCMFVCTSKYTDSSWHSLQCYYNYTTMTDITSWCIRSVKTFSFQHFDTSHTAWPATARQATTTWLPGLVSFQLPVTTATDMLTMPSLCLPQYTLTLTVWFIHATSTDVMSLVIRQNSWE